MGVKAISAVRLRPLLRMRLSTALLKLPLDPWICADPDRFGDKRLEIYGSRSVGVFLGQRARHRNRHVSVFASNSSYPKRQRVCLWIFWVGHSSTLKLPTRTSLRISRTRAAVPCEVSLGYRETELLHNTSGCLRNIEPVDRSEPAWNLASRRLDCSFIQYECAGKSGASLSVQICLANGRMASRERGRGRVGV